MEGFRGAFPDLNFWGAADPIAEGDYVVGPWDGGGTHSGPAFSDFLIGSLFNEDRTVCVVYNGEIYNFQSLVTELNGPEHQSAETLFVGIEL